MMAQGSEEFVAVIAALNQRTATQAETSIEMQRPFGASASHPALGPQPIFAPLPPVEDSQCSNHRERLTQAQVLSPLVQPNERLNSLDVNELDSTTVKLQTLRSSSNWHRALTPFPTLRMGTLRLPSGSQTDSKCHISTVSTGL